MAKEEEVAESPVAEGVIQHSLFAEEKRQDNLGDSSTSLRKIDSIANEQLKELGNDDARSTTSVQGSKTNFGFLLVPKNCRVSPTKPYHLNLATNILFGFASTFTVVTL